jgi:predicted DNA repair protein MutK
MMKAISVIGTAAMFMVGGGILVHGIPGAEALVHNMARMGGPLEMMVAVAVSAIAGVVAGAIALTCVSAVQRLFRSSTRAAI